MEDDGQSGQKPSTGFSGAGLQVIEGGRLAREWRLLEMIVSPHRYSVEECAALQDELAPRGRDQVRLAGGTATLKMLSGNRDTEPGSE